MPKSATRDRELVRPPHCPCDYLVSHEVLCTSWPAALSIRALLPSHLSPATNRGHRFYLARYNTNPAPGNQRGSGPFLACRDWRLWSVKWTVGWRFEASSKEAELRLTSGKPIIPCPARGSRRREIFPMPSDVLIPWIKFDGLKFPDCLLFLMAVISAIKKRAARLGQHGHAKLLKGTASQGPRQSTMYLSTRLHTGLHMKARYELMRSLPAHDQDAYRLIRS